MLLGQQHELLHSGPPVDPNIYQATIHSAGAALALVAWDTLLTLEDEIEYIWSRSSHAHVKWIYLFARWFGLLNQISFQIWLYFLATLAPVQLSICEGLFVYEAVTYQLLQLCLDAILTLRIWAVYQRQRRYIVFALVIILFETLMAIVTQVVGVPKSTIDCTCQVVRTPTVTTCLGIGVTISQVALLSLTYRGQARLEPAVRRSKLITVVVRDGILVFGSMIGVVLVATLYLIFNQAFINVFWPWLPVLPSLLTPRMILNLQKAVDVPEPALEFSTDMGNVPCDETRLPTHLYEMTAIYERPVTS